MSFAAGLAVGLVAGAVAVMFYLVRLCRSVMR